MTVLVRSKRVESTRRRRQTPERHSVAHPAPAGAGVQTHEQRTRDRQVWSGQRLANDRAVYTCQCGYVFEAPVSTSVGCPHCGGTQAW
jgi:rubrerythrin